MSQTSWEDEEIYGQAFSTSASSPLDVVSTRDLLSDLAINLDRPGHVLVSDRPSIDFEIDTVENIWQPVFAYPVTLDLRADSKPFSIRSRSRSYWSGAGGAAKEPNVLVQLVFLPRGPIGNVQPSSGILIHEVDMDDSNDSSSKSSVLTGFAFEIKNLQPWLRQNTVDYNGVSTTVQLFQGQIAIFAKFGGWSGTGTEPSTIDVVFDQLHISTWYGEV